MAASPAVILNNIPSFLRSNGKTTAIHVLGSKTGTEVGACYWKLHPTMPSFMVVFKNRIDRDDWYNTSMKLKEMMGKGVMVTTAWYNRDLDKVLGEEEGKGLDDGKGRKKGGGGGYMKLLEERDRNVGGEVARGINRKGIGRKIPSLVGDFKKTNLSVDNMSALSAEIEDLDKLKTSQFIFAQKNKLDNLVNFPPPPLLPRNPTSIPLVKTLPSQVPQPVSSARSYNLRSGVISKPSPGLNMSQDFSVPPPPLRLPLHVKPAKVVAQDMKTEAIKVEFNSNILAKLEDAVSESLEHDKENKIVGDIKHISRTVAESWKPNIENFEKIYEAVLSEPAMNVPKLTEDLEISYNWEGCDVVTRDQALAWTKDFLVKAGMNAGTDMETNFTRFLSKNTKRFKISSDEVIFIMQRNGLDVGSLCKAFTENSNSVGFRNFVKNSVSISGQLLNDFSGVFLEFFKSKIDQENNRSSRNISQVMQSDGHIKTLADLGSSMNVKGDSKKITLKDDSDKLKYLLGQNDLKGVKQLVNEISDKMKTLASSNEVLENKNMEILKLNYKITAENKLIKDDFHEKTKAANQENKMLRARNTSLQDDIRKTKEDKEEVQTKIDKIVNFAEAVARADTDELEMLLQSPLGENNDEVGKMKHALGSLIKSQKFNVKHLKTKVDVTYGESRSKKTMVKLAVSEDNSDSVRNMMVSTNQEKLVNMNEVEIVVRRKVTGLKFRKGKGWKNLKVEERMAHPPAAGWGDREYLVVIQDEGGPVHLGQGCVSTPGQERRQENTGREGPMFPPHVIGPRITTE